MADEIMTGLNPSADQALARDLGVTLSPEQDEVTPLVAIGPAGYTVDAKGEPVETPMPTPTSKFFRLLYESQTITEKCAFHQGMIYARNLLIGEEITNWNDAHNVIEAETNRLCGK